MGNPYTRQSSAEIVTGLIVEASPLNAEFNALQSAFNGSTGHSHDGSVGEGPKISLLNSVANILQVENGGIGGLNKLDATTDPGVTDDSSDNYVVGSLWVNVTTDKIFICVDNTGGAAIWKGLQDLSSPLTSIAGLTTSANQTIYTTSSNVYATTPLTAFGRSLIDDADASTALTTLGFSAFIKTLIDDADASTARTTLGLGSMATQNSSSVTITGGTISGVPVTSSNVTITGGSISGITDLAVADGGTGASDATGARSNLGLGNVDNTSDANKPVSTATQTALDLKANLASPALTGTPTAPTATSGTNTTQIATTAFVTTAINAIQLTPAGAVSAFAMNSAPTGWIKANGAAVSRTTYSTLFSAIGTTFGVGDGSTTFNLPDLRGEFVRGWDDARGVDSGRSFGTAQTDLVKAHTHTGTTSTNGSHTHGGGSLVGVYGAPGGGSYLEEGQTGPNYYISSMNADGSHNHTFTTDANSGAENRPRNVALLYCIKF